MKPPLSMGACLLALAVVLLTAENASAHARLKESTPEVGEVLQTSPTEVSITFTNDIQKISGSYGIDVTYEAGAPVTAGPAVIDDDNRSIMSVRLQPNLPPGRYIVKYKNVSDVDGDPFEGGFAFYVGVQPTAEQLAADAELQAEEDTPTPALETPTPARGAPTPLSTSSPVEAGDDGGDDNGTLVTLVFVGAAAVVLAVIAGVLWRASRRRKS